MRARGGRASPPPCCQCKSPGTAELSPGETGRVSAGFPQAQETRLCLQSRLPTAFVGGLDNGYSLPAGAGTLTPMGPPLHPDTWYFGSLQPPNWCAPDSPNSAPPQQHHPLVPPGVPESEAAGGFWGCPVPPTGRCFLQRGRGREVRVLQELACNQGWRQRRCLQPWLSFKRSALPETGYNSHLHHTLKYRPSQSEVSTCQPHTNIIQVSRQILGTGPGACPASPRAPQRLLACGRPGFPTDACNGMASLLLFSLDWSRLLMEKQPKQHGWQVVHSRGGGVPCRRNGSPPRHGAVEVAQNLRSRMVVWQSHDSVTKAMTESV